MNKNKYLIYTALLLLCSCKTLPLHQESQTKTTQSLTLGSVGSGKDFILQKAFKSSSYPKYNAPIKLSVIKEPFNKSNYKSFLKARAVQPSKVNITYIDSLKPKPYYIKLKIADKVALIKALNGKTNYNVNRYLELHPYANLITSLSIAFNEQDLKQIEQARSVFLVEESLKTYALELFTKDGKTKTIPFGSGVVFAYKASNCCWRGQRKARPYIVDVVTEFNNCPNGTYRSANRANNKVAPKKNINYFKL